MFNRTLLLSSVDRFGRLTVGRWRLEPPKKVEGKEGEMDLMNAEEVGRVTEDDDIRLSNGLEGFGGMRLTWADAEVYGDKGGLIGAETKAPRCGFGRSRGIRSISVPVRPLFPPAPPPPLPAPPFLPLTVPTADNFRAIFDLGKPRSAFAEVVLQ